jgi:hypothetical protein
MARARISSWSSRRERRIEPSVMRSASREVGHLRREFGEQYNSFPLRSFQISERHSREPTPPTGSSSECPIFDVQFGDPSELSRVVRNQPHAKTAGMGRNEQVVRADHRAKSL